MNPFIHTMIEMVDKYALVKGQRYYVKRTCPISVYTATSYDCLFDRYDEEFEDFVWVILFTLEYELALDLSTFYRYVSREEFYAKVKEKYDQTCLNLVLKRLVNDDFRWI